MAKEDTSPKTVETLKHEAAMGHHRSKLVAGMLRLCIVLGVCGQAIAGGQILSVYRSQVSP